MPQDEPDISNFSTSSEHKLPAVSGVQALQDELRRARGVPTSLPTLDQSSSQPGLLQMNNGIRRGCVTEVFGPPGSGKSTFGMQIAVNALRTFDEDTKVVWLSTSSPLMRSRLVALANDQGSSNTNGLASSPPRSGSETLDIDARFVYKEITSLPQLLVMLMHPTAIFPPPNTATLVVDGLANFLLGALPRQARSEDSKSTVLHEHNAKKANSKRYQLIDNLAAALSRLATSRHIAIIILMNATTSMKSGQKAVLKPALSSQGWNAAIYTRVTLYRDLYPQQYRAKLTLKEKRGYRLAEITRLNTKDVIREPVPFVIEEGGLRELDIHQHVFDSARPPPIFERNTDQNAPMPLDVHSNEAQPEHNTYTLLPTASQVLRQEYNTIDTEVKLPELQDPAIHSTDLPIDLAVPTPAPAATTTTIQVSERTISRTSKRKAIEIADSEDEEDDDESLLPPPTLPPAPSSPVVLRAAVNNPAITAASAEQPADAKLEEEMLFDRHEHR